MSKKQTKERELVTRNRFKNVKHDTSDPSGVDPAHAPYVDARTKRTKDLARNREASMKRQAKAEAKIEAESKEDKS